MTTKVDRRTFLAATAAAALTPALPIVPDVLPIIPIPVTDRDKIWCVYIDVLYHYIDHDRMLIRRQVIADVETEDN